MVIIDTQTIELFFNLSKDKSKPFEELYDIIVKTPIDSMFRRFHVDKNEEKACLFTIFKRDFDTFGLSRDTSEVVHYVKKSIERESDIRKFLDKVHTEKENIANFILGLSRSYLPEEVVLEDFKIYFIPLPYNAVTEGNEVFIDPIFSMEMGIDLLKLILSHAAHHIGRNSITADYSKPDIKKISGKLVDIFLSLETEGIANCVFNGSMIPQMEKLRSFWIKTTQNYSTHLKALQDIYLGVSLGTLTDEEAWNDLNEKWLNHGYTQPVSFRMAKEIENAFGKEKLKTTVGNTVKFLKTYQLAAYKNNLFLLEDKLIEELEKDLTGS